MVGGAVACFIVVLTILSAVIVHGQSPETASLGQQPDPRYSDAMVQYQFAIAFSSKANAIKAASLLDREGLTTSLENGATDSSWLVAGMSYADVDLDRIEARVLEISEALDGEYLGSGGISIEGSGSGD